MKLSKILCVGTLMASLALTQSAFATTAIFNFDSDTVFTDTTFTDTDNGISATFSSPVDPGGFTVAPSFFATLTGNVLLDPGRAEEDGLPLAIQFSEPVSSISFNFATHSSDSAPLYLLSFLGSTTPVFTGATTADSLPNFFYPEGFLVFNNTTSFDTVFLFSPATDFAIDNVIVSDSALPGVSTSAVPEPSTTVAMGLGALGMSGLLFFARRRSMSSL